MSPSHVSRERLEAVSALRAAGPNAPTLCAGWSTLDLAAHLVVRERRPDSSVGMLVPALERWTDHVRRSYAEQGFDSLLERIARGPAAISPWRWPAIENAVNLLEYFVHTEDVRRAQPGWEPRRLEPEREEALWHYFTKQARFAFRGRSTALELRTPDGGRQHLLGGATSAEALVGEVGELIMYAFGRRGHARVSSSR